MEDVAPPVPSAGRSSNKKIVLLFNVSSFICMFPVYVASLLTMCGIFIFGSLLFFVIVSAQMFLSSKFVDNKNSKSWTPIETCSCVVMFFVLVVGFFLMSVLMFLGGLLACFSCICPFYKIKKKNSKNRTTPHQSGPSRVMEQFVRRFHQLMAAVHPAGEAMINIIEGGEGVAEVDVRNEKRDDVSSQKLNQCSICLRGTRRKFLFGCAHHVCSRCSSKIASCPFCT